MAATREKAQLMSASEIDRTLVRLAHEILEKTGNLDQLAFIGIRRRGVPLAQRLAHKINMLVIDPDECIDCTLCVPECPVEAIFAEDDVPPGQRDWIPLNAELAKVWKPIVERKPAPADADEWAKVKDKKGLLER